MGGRYCCGVLSALLYASVDLTLVSLALIVCHNPTNMLSVLVRIVDNGANDLLTLCPSWTMDVVEELKGNSAVAYGTLVIGTMGCSLTALVDLSFVLSIACNGTCPNTPTQAVHFFMLITLCFFGTALLFTCTSFALQWKNAGNPFYGKTDPRGFDGYYETSCFGYGGCSGSYLNVVAEHDEWCPTSRSPLIDVAQPLTVITGVLFGVAWLVMLGGVIYSCCWVYKTSLRFKLAIASPVMLTSLCGLIIGGIQFPLVLPWIFASALWKYVRLLVNRIAGVQQSDLDKEFQVNPHKDGDMVPGLVGAPPVGDGGGEMDAGGYMGY